MIDSIHFRNGSTITFKFTGDEAFKGLWEQYEKLLEFTTRQLIKACRESKLSETETQTVVLSNPVRNAIINEMVKLREYTISVTVVNNHLL